MSRARAAAIAVAACAGVPATRLRRYERRLGEGKRPFLNLLLAVSDAEGNMTTEQHMVFIRR